jgi:DNA primase
VFVCEGIPDALSITQAGHHAVALLGVGRARHTIAHRLATSHPERPLRLALDADPRGIDARDALVDELADLEHPDVAVVELPSGVTDINEWLRIDPHTFATCVERAAASSLTRDLAIDLHR